MPATDHTNSDTTTKDQKRDLTCAERLLTQAKQSPTRVVYAVAIQQSICVMVLLVIPARHNCKSSTRFFHNQTTPQARKIVRFVRTRQTCRCVESVWNPTAHQTFDDQRCRLFTLDSVCCACTREQVDYVI